jgi:hypothetical protein
LSRLRYTTGVVNNVKSCESSIHQLPIWVARRVAEGRRLWHNPAMRECALGSVTSFTYSGDRLAGVSYTVPARRQVTQGDAAQ